MKKNPELEMINSKLNAIEKVCNEFTGQKFVTEDILAQFLACTLQKIAEMNTKQEEKFNYGKENYNILESQFKMMMNEINLGLIPIRKRLEFQHTKQSMFKKILNFLN